MLSQERWRPVRHHGPDQTRARLRSYMRPDVVQDDEARLAAAWRLIRKCVSDGQALFVPVTVTLELEWVLRASFEYGKDEVLQALSSQFSAAELFSNRIGRPKSRCTCIGTAPPTSPTACTSRWQARPASCPYGR